MHPERAWSPGQRALLGFLQREGALANPLDPPGQELVSDEAFFALLAARVDAAAVARLLAERLHLALVGNDVPAADDAAALLDESLARRCGMVAVDVAEGTLEVATANPLDIEAVKTLEFSTGRRVRVRVATHAGVQAAMARVYGGAPPEAAGAPAPAVEPAMPAPVEPEPEADLAPAAAPGGEPVADTGVAAGAGAAPPEEPDRLDALAARIATEREAMAGALAEVDQRLGELAARVEGVAALTGRAPTADALDSVAADTRRLAAALEEAAAERAALRETVAALEAQVAAGNRAREQARAEGVLRAQETEGRVGPRLAAVEARAAAAAEEIARLRRDAVPAEAVAAVGAQLEPLGTRVRETQAELVAVRYDVAQAVEELRSLARVAAEHARDALAQAAQRGEELDALRRELGRDREDALTRFERVEHEQATAREREDAARGAAARAADDLDGEVDSLRDAIERVHARLRALEDRAAAGPVGRLVATARDQAAGALTVAASLVAVVVRLALRR